KKAEDGNAPDESGTDLPQILSKISPKAVKDEGPADVSYKVDTNVVNLDVSVLDNKGNPISGIRKENFRILEDNVPQTTTQFATTQAPMTVALVVEFSNRYQSYWSQGWYETLTAVYGFT